MKGHRILLVEDNADDVELTLHAFHKTGLDDIITVARDGEEALALLFGSAPKPDLVLLDLKLPGISGLEVLRRIRTEDATRRLPVVILTTSDDENDLMRGYDLGVNSYVRKPVDFQAFTTAVDQLGLYWLRLNLAAPR